MDRGEHPSFPIGPAVTASLLISLSSVARAATMIPFSTNVSLSTLFKMETSRIIMISRLRLVIFLQSKTNNFPQNNF